MADTKTIAKNKAHVVNRHGDKIAVSFDKIKDRIEELCEPIGNQGALSSIDAVELMQKTISRFRSGMKTSEIDSILISNCLIDSTLNYEYGILSARLSISNFHKTNKLNLIQMIELLESQGEYCRLNKQYISLIKLYHEQFEKFIDHNRDYMFSHFAFQTLIKSYLLRKNGENSEIVERPQYMYLRVAICTELSIDEIKYMIDSKSDDSKQIDVYIQRIKHNYDMLSKQLISHATPTIFNSGCKRQQLASCFLMAVDDDLEVIMDTIKSAALASKWAGGLGINLTPMRAEGASIKSTGGKSSGIGKLLRLLDAEQSYSTQGGIRAGSFAVYLEVWHADIITFIHCARKTGKDVELGETHNLKYALWVPDLFMKAVETDGDWYLMSPDQSPNLHKTHGKEFENLYMKYVAEKKFVRIIKARTIAMEWIKSIAQSGHPYLLHKDHINNKSILSNIRTIGCSNLCSEILIPAWNDEGKSEESEFGVCVLGSIPLGNYIKNKGGAENNYWTQIDFQGIMTASQKLVHNLNVAIDKNFYPLPACERSTFRHRPIGIGICGLADAFHKLGISFDMKIALEIDEAIAAVIYYAAVQKSCEIGRKLGGFSSQHKNGHSGFIPKLQPDLWRENNHLDKDWESRIEKNTGGLVTAANWNELRTELMNGNLRNSYLTAYMPTASTSNLVSQNESFECFTSNIYSRQTLSGTHIIVNKYLIDELNKLGVWNEELRLEIIRNNGSVQNIPEIPDNIKYRYKTAREIDQRILTLHSAKRGPFICQTQSLNYFFDDITFEKVWSNIALGHKLGLKTGSYYIHSSPGSQVHGSNLGIKKKESSKKSAIRRKSNGEICTVCSG